MRQAKKYPEVEIDEIQKNAEETGMNTSALGFAACALPVVGDDDAQIDMPEAIRNDPYAVDNGVNYIDSAYGCHRGRGERGGRPGAQDGYREKVYRPRIFPPRI